MSIDFKSKKKILIKTNPEIERNTNIKKKIEELKKIQEEILKNSKEITNNSQELIKNQDQLIKNQNQLLKNQKELKKNKKNLQKNQIKLPKKLEELQHNPIKKFINILQNPKIEKFPEKKFSCGCKKSKCVRLHCLCFSNSEKCAPSCSCENCINNDKF